MKSRLGFRELVARGADVVKGDVHWSDEQRVYLKAKLKCQSCWHQDPIRGAVQYQLPDGTTLSAGQHMGLLPKEAIAQCRSCNARWPVFKGGSTAAIGAGSEAVETVETERAVVPHHSDPLELDNLDGTSPLKHTVTISQEWAQTVQLDDEKSKVEGGTTSADLPGVGTFGRKAEAAGQVHLLDHRGHEEVAHARVQLRGPARHEARGLVQLRAGVATRSRPAARHRRRDRGDPVQSRGRHDGQRRPARHDCLSPGQRAATMTAAPS